MKATSLVKSVGNCPCIDKKESKRISTPFYCYKISTICVSKTENNSKFIVKSKVVCYIFVLIESKKISDKGVFVAQKNDFDSLLLKLKGV